MSAIYNTCATIESMTAESLKKSAKDIEKESAFERAVSAERRKVAGSIAKHRKLINNLLGDLEKHGDPEIWKRYGDLLLANVGNATRKGDRVMVTDYFASPVLISI